MSILPLSSTWRANFRPHFEGIRYRWGDLVLNLVVGKRYTLTMEYDESYLTEDPESPISLHCRPGPLASGIEFSPPEQQLVDLAWDPHHFSSVTWTISTEQAHPGPFHLYFSMPGYHGMPDSPSISGQIESVVVDSLTCDLPVTYTGYEVKAQALVLTSPSGQPVSGVALSCTYAERPLPYAITDEKGIASFTFAVTEIGEHDLVVTSLTASPDSKTQKIVVQALQPARVYGVSAYPLTLRIGESSSITATVRNVLTLQPSEGRKVHWKADDQEFDMSYTNSSGKAETNWVATRSGAVKIWAYVYNQNNTEVGSVDLNVL